MFPRDGYVQGIKALKAIGGNFDFDFSANKISVETERPDVVVDYKGTIREDDFFNILHEDGLTIAGIAIDVNPITEDKTGLLAEYLESAEQYLKEKAQERKREKPSVREKIKQAKRVSQDKKIGNIGKSKNVER